MIRLILCSAAILIYSLSPAMINENIRSIETSVKNPTPAHDTVGANLLLKRLNEIKAMNMSNLSFAEKRALRKEVRDIKGQLKEQGFLLTVGLLAIIAMLLVIILDPFNK